MMNTMHPQQQKLANSISEIVMIVSFAMLFATLMLGYTMYRLTSDSWPPMGLQRVDLAIPMLSTFVLVLSSLTLSHYTKNRLANLQAAKHSLWATIFLGAVFGISQFLLWQDLAAVGLIASEGIFQSILYGFTWIHAAHVVLAWAGLFLLIPAIGNQENKWVARAGLVTKFWHFLDIVWLIMFITIFVL